MSIRLYDSKRQELVDFVPLEPGKLGIYVCGPTVQSEPHIGHLRSTLVYDLWWRWWDYRGFQVTMVRNVTDIDDKILDKAAESGEAWWALASRIEREFHRISDALRIRRPALEPRATGDIPAMVELIQKLIDRGHAYVADNGSGDVYFDVSSWPDYGELTHQSPDKMEQGETAAAGKRSALDFALWKGHKDSEPDTAAWPAPWGAGRPGWHLECSAMSARYLGQSFDIHGGGVDLRFPHHENELAQSRAAGDHSATYWLHSALVQVDGQKMSKSLGNSILAATWLEAARPIVVRYQLATAHYRSVIDLHEGALEEAARAFGRIDGFVERSGVTSWAEAELPDDFVAAMDDDLGIPQALAVIHERVRSGNQAIDHGETEKAQDIARQVLAMLDVLGLNPLSPEWAEESPGAEASDVALHALVEGLLSARDEARADKDFDRADQLRDLLQASGIEVTDSAEGSDWSIRGS